MIESGDKIQPRIVCHFHDYEPPLDIHRIAARLLASVPPRYLTGLDAVVLTNKRALPRDRRRSKNRSRKRTVRIMQTRGLYHPTWKSKQAWIEIFVDSVLREPLRGWWLKFPLFQDLLLSPVFFHELGHHIHTLRPEFRDKEDVAEKWQARLEADYLYKQYLVMRVLVLIGKPFRKPIRKLREKLEHRWGMNSSIGRPGSKPRSAD
jgi:hypothetical protein